MLFCEMSPFAERTILLGRPMASPLALLLFCGNGLDLIDLHNLPAKFRANVNRIVRWEECATAVIYGANVQNVLSAL
jgi:hypothetical protein